MDFKKYVARIVGACLALERGHTILKSVHPRYSKFCDDAKLRVMRKARMVTTVRDVLEGHIGKEYHIHVLNSFYDIKFKIESVEWFFRNRFDLAGLYTIQSDDTRGPFGLVADKNLVVDYVSQGAFSVTWRFHEPYILSRDRTKWLEGDGRVGHVAEMYPAKTLRLFKNNELSCALASLEPGNGEVVVCCPGSGEKCQQQPDFCTELFEFIDNAYDDIGLVHYAGSYDGEKGRLKWTAFSDLHETKRCRLEASPDVSLYSEDVQKNLIHDLLSFVEKQDKFTNQNRKYLLVGPPGTGKSSLIKKIIRLVPEDYTPFIPSHLAVSAIREIEMRKKKMLVIIEDIDLMLDDEALLHGLLQFLDGFGDLESSIVLMTTNYPEKLPASLLDRPGRIDKIVELVPADLELRRKQAASIFNANAEEIAEITEGFTFAHYGELYRRLQLFPDDPWQEAVTEMKRDIARRKAYLKNERVHA